MYFCFWHLGDFSSGLPSLSDFEFKSEEFRIAACGLPGYSDLWLDASFHCIKGGNRIHASDPILRRVRLVRSMHPVLIVPDLVLVESLLHPVCRGDHPCGSHPALHGAEESFDLPVELPDPDPAFHMPDSLQLASLLEASSELRSVVADQKFGCHIGSFHRVLDQQVHVMRMGSSSERPDRQQLARVPVQYRRDLEPLPEHADLGDVGVPDMVWVFGLEQTVCMMRGWGWSRAVLPPRPGKVFFQYPADRGPADLDARADQLPCDGSSTKVILRAEAADLVNGVPHPFMQSIPWRRSEQLIHPILVQQRFLPRADGVRVQPESIGGLLCAPLAQCRQLHDLRPLLGGEVGALSWRLR